MRRTTEPSARIVTSLYACALSSPLVHFKEDALRLVQAEFPFSSAAWGSGVFSTNTMLSLTLLDQPNEMLLEYAMLWQEQDYCRNAAATSPGRAFSNGTVQPWDVYRRSDIYRLFSKPWGIEDSLTIVQRADGLDLAEVICLFRNDQHPVYEHEDAAFLEVIAPHLAAARNHAQIAHGLANGVAGTQPDLTGTGHYAVASDSGLLHAAGNAFLVAMRTLEPEWVGPTVPSLLLPLCGGTTPSVCVGEMVVSARLVDGMAVLSAGSDLVSTLLTPAELKAARLYAGGSTQKVIASALGLSPSTIRNQLASAYAKLGCHSKVELARRVGRA